LRRFIPFEVFLKILYPLLVSLALLINEPANAQSNEGEVDPNQDLQIPDADVIGLDGAGGVDLSAPTQVGNPLKDKLEWWPEDLVVAPIPGRSPQIGWNLSLAGAYFLEPRDEDSDVPASTIAAFAMYSENGSYAYGAGTYLHLMDDRLRVKAGAAYMDIRYGFYGIGNAMADLGIGIDILQEGPMYFGSAQWRVWNKLYIGLGYLSGEVDSSPRIIIPDTNAFDPTLTSELGAYALPIDFDTRDHEQFPRNGWLVSARNLFYRKSAGGDFDAETYKFTVNHYRPVREQDVLAFRGYFRMTNGDAPFFLLSTFGGSTDLRGYPGGRYRDRMMYAMQSEYRWQFNESWIFTGFAGFGEVAEKLSGFGENYLPAAGIGARYVISKKHRVGLSFDIAQGKDGTEYYFGVGEAF